MRLWPLKIAAAIPTEGHLMTKRVTTKTVVFSRPFVLNEEDGEQQPGILR